MTAQNEELKSIVLKLPPIAVAPAECEPRDGLTRAATTERLRCHVDMRLAKRLGRSMTRTNLTRCGR